jgi:hypothetical protein
MLPLILAAAVAGAPLKAPPDCSPPQVKTLAPAEPPQTRKLGELPDAMQIRAVMRSIGGCQYQDVARFHVSTPGPYYPSGTLAPVDGGIEPVTPTDEKR